MTERDQCVFYFADPLPPGCPDAKAVLGGKGQGLKQMTRAGLHVPPGFTIRAECCERYFALGRQWPDGLEQEVRENLERLERDTGRVFGRGQRPLLVSVRSGAAVSMPGMMDTLLNCGLGPALADELGDTPWFWDLYLQFILAFARTVAGIKEGAFADAATRRPADRAACHTALRIYEQKARVALPTDPWDLLRQCINAVFDSWHSERAVAYRDRHDIRGLHGTAVNVQAMFPSEVSGILFTQNPVDLHANQMVIEASYGLGEAVVSGDVTPDRFLVRRDALGQIVATLGHKASVVAAFGERRELDPAAPSLTPQQIAELAELALRVERHFGHPVDIEWGWAEGQFALLQARPIRGLAVAVDVENARLEEIERLKGPAGAPRRLWVTHNLAETLRAPTPLTWDIIRRFMSGSGGFGQLYRQFGYRPSRRVSDQGFLELIGGRIYADPDRLAELFWEDMPLAYDLDQLAANKAMLDRAPTKFDAARADGLFLARLPRNLAAMWRVARNMKRARADAKRSFEENVLPPYLRYIEEKRSQDLAALPDDQLMAELRDRCRRVLDEFGPESLKPGFFGGLAFDAAERLLVQLLGERDGGELARTLVLGLDGDITFEQDALLYRVATGQALMSDFLRRFGHRCTGEMELSVPRWRESSAYLEQTIRRLQSARGHSPEQIHHRNVEKREAAQASLPAALASAGGSSLREQIERDLTDARALLPYRETGKHYLMMGYELIRLAILELAVRWDLGGGMFFLRLEEIEQHAQPRGRFADLIAQRRVRWQALQRLDMPDVIDSEKLDSLGLPQVVQAAAELQGTTMAPGVATGTARIVSDPQDPGDLGSEYVLVCSSTDPGWTPLFLNALGLVVERGGVLSHGAIVARDFGIPAVACPNATRALRSGDTVRVDGNSGRVVVLQRASPNA